MPNELPDGPSISSAEQWVEAANAADLVRAPLAALAPLKRPAPQRSRRTYTRCRRSSRSLRQGRSGRFVRTARPSDKASADWLLRRSPRRRRRRTKRANTDLRLRPQATPCWHDSTADWRRSAFPRQTSARRPRAALHLARVCPLRSACQRPSASHSLQVSSSLGRAASARAGRQSGAPHRQRRFPFPKG